MWRYSIDDIDYVDNDIFNGMLIKDKNNDRNNYIGTIYSIGNIWMHNR